MCQCTSTPVPGKPYFIITEDAERQLWRSRTLVKTLAGLAEHSPSRDTIQISAEELSVTLYLVVELLNLPLTYISKGE